MPADGELAWGQRNRLRRSVYPDVAARPSMPEVPMIATVAPVDAQIVHEAANGDPGALEALYQSYAEPAWQLAQAVARSSTSPCPGHSTSVH